MIGSFAAYYVFLLAGNQVLLGLAASFAASFVLGILVYKVCYERFFNAPRHISLLCTIGFSMLVKNLAQIVFGPNQKPMLEVIPLRFFSLGSMRISLVQLVIIGTVAALAFSLSFIFNKTKFGIMLKAVSQDKSAAWLMGINVRRAAMLGNCLGCGLGGVGGLLLGIYYQNILATMGGSMGMKAFTSSVLGGLTDVRFSALGGMIIGIVENLGITVSSASFRDIFAFSFLILILIFRPQGFTSKLGEKV